MTGDASNRRVRVLVNGLHAHSGGGVTYLRNMLPLLAGDGELELHLALHRHQGDLFSPLDSRVRVHFAGFWRIWSGREPSAPLTLADC